MNRLCAWASLLVGAFSLAISPPAAQGRRARRVYESQREAKRLLGRAEAYPAEEFFEQVWLNKESLEEEYPDEEELAEIKARANMPTTPQGRRVLAERLQPLEKEVEGLRQEIVGIKEAQLGKSKLNESVNNPQRSSPNCHGLTELANEAISGPLNQSCPKTIEVIASRTTKKFDVSVSSDQIRLTKGTNTLYIDFRSVQDGQPTDPGEVSAEATMSTRLLAVARVDRLAVGRYCAHVNFPLPGYWLITVKHGGSQDSGTIKFFGSVD